MTREEIASRLEAFVRAHFTVAPTDTAFTRTTSLFERGYIDSVGVVELVAFLSEEFGVRLTDADLLSAHFQTVDGIAGIVDGLRQRSHEPSWRRWVSRVLPAT